MLIPRSHANKLRNFQNGVFHREDIPRHEREYVFYLLLRPMLNDFKKEIKDLGLESWEAESEIYLMTCLLFKRFDPSKSSIVPFIANQLGWVASAIKNRLSKNREDPAGLIQSHGHYSMQEEFYWTVPNILLEDRFIGNLFTKSERYLIYMILESDDDELSQVSIAEKLKVNRRTWIARMNELRELFELEEFNANA